MPSAGREALLTRLGDLASDAGLTQTGAPVAAAAPRSAEEWAELLAVEGAEPALAALLERFFVRHTNVPGLLVQVAGSLVRRCGPAAAEPLAAAAWDAVLAVRLRPEMLSSERAVGEVRARIEQAAQRLIDRGEIDHEDSPGTVPGGISGALLLARPLDTRTLVAIHREAGLSKPEWAVLDAAVHRTALVETPVRRLLAWWAEVDPDGLRRGLVRLWHRPCCVLDDSARRDRAVAGVASLMGEGYAAAERLVPEALGELDRAVRGEVAQWLGRLGDSDALGILLRIAADPDLRRNDPMLVADAKASLVRHALRQRLGVELAARRGGERLPGPGGWRWMFDRAGWFRADRARALGSEKLARLASSIQGLLQVARRPGPAGDETRGRAFELELVRLSDTLELLLLLADLFLDQPRGAQRLAEALFGMDRVWQREVRARIDRQVERLMARQIAERLGAAGGLIEWLRGLRLVDRETFLAVLNRLDVGTNQFGSLADRDWAVGVLAVPYAELLLERRMERTLQRRFRALVRILHVDGLRAQLSPDGFARLEREFGEQLRDWYSLLLAAKNYLGRLQSHYRELTEDFLFEEDRFKGEVERRQLAVLAAALGLEEVWRGLGGQSGGR